MSSKATKQSVLYSPPEKGSKTCEDCIMFLSSTKTCAIHDSSVLVSKTSSCGHYIWNMGDASTEAIKVSSFVTPEESGLVHTKDGVQCKRCVNFLSATNDCKIVSSEGGPGNRIEPEGHCNAWVGDVVTSVSHVREARTSSRISQIVTKILRESEDSSENRYYVPYSSIFDSIGYNITRIVKAAERAGAKDIIVERQYGWANEPSVVVFTTNNPVAVSLEVKKALGTEYISVHRKEWTD